MAKAQWKWGYHTISAGCCKRYFVYMSAHMCKYRMVLTGGTHEDSHLQDSQKLIRGILKCYTTKLAPVKTSIFQKHLGPQQRFIIDVDKTVVLFKNSHKNTYIIKLFECLASKVGRMICFQFSFCSHPAEHHKYCPQKTPNCQL